MAEQSGAKIIAKALKDLGVSVIFGIVGIPIVEIADEAIRLGIRFLAFRNEQSASYAASAYGYLTGRPGVCLVVGGPGVLHAIAGIGNATANCFPLLLVAGSSETHLVTQGAFQELDAVSLLTPHTKLATRPPSLESVPDIIENAYRISFYGRPGATFVDFPANIIKGTSLAADPLPVVSAAPLFTPPREQIDQIAQLLRNAERPLIVIGKGAAYSNAELPIRELVESTQVPFLPTPMGKGVVPDDHARNVSSARSTALQLADVVLLLGARLNWILHMGAPPKWSEGATFIQVDIEPTEIGRNTGTASLGLVGDVGLVVEQIRHSLGTWSFRADDNSSYLSSLAAASTRNEEKAAKMAGQVVPVGKSLTFHRAFDIIKTHLHELAPPESGRIVYVSEGANTMDISRSIFPLAFPRQRLDAGTLAAMGVGLGYAIAAHAAYNPATGPSNLQKKIVCLEGDSALGFSAPEIETMQRAGMDILIFVFNNGGVYHGEVDDADKWQTQATQGKLLSTTLGFDTKYEMLAEMCGGKGYSVRTEDELAKATREGFQEKRVCVVNVHIESGTGRKVGFAWESSGKRKVADNAKL